MPADRYELAVWKKATVSIDYHVEYDRRCYSVPFRLVRQKMEIRASRATVGVYYSHRPASCCPRPGVGTAGRAVAELTGRLPAAIPSPPAARCWG